MSELLFHLTPLTPLHIGSGEQLEPFEYVITGQTMYRFSLDRFMLALSPEEQAAFVEVVAQSIPATRAFVTRCAAVARQVARWQAAVSGAAGDLYQGRLSRGVGQPEVLACIRTSDRLYLPGSSLKGAIRTAMLYQAMPRPEAGRDARYLEQTIFQFKAVPEDPFRAFKLGDGQPLSGPSKVRSVAVNTRRRGQWEEEVGMLVETIPGQLSDGTAESSIHPVQFDETFYRLHPGAFPITPERILAACREFYGLHLARERDYTADSPAAGAYQALATYAAAMPPHTCLVRLGWGSGHEATTVSYGLAGSELATSRRLAEDGFPLGWAELKIEDPAGRPVSMGETETLPAPPPTPAGSGRPRSLADLSVGLILSGRVVRLAEYGAFVDIGVGRDGLIHISQLAAGRPVQRVEEIVKKGDRVRVEIIRLEPEQRRIGLKLLAVEKP